MILLPSLLVPMCCALHFCLHSLQNHDLHLFFLHPSISHTQYLQQYFLAASSVARYYIPSNTFFANNTSYSGIIHCTIFSSSLSLKSTFVLLIFFFDWTLTGLLLSTNFRALQPSNSKRNLCWYIQSCSLSGSLHRTLEFLCKQLASTWFSLVSVSSS